MKQTLIAEFKNMGMSVNVMGDQIDGYSKSQIKDGIIIDGELMMSVKKDGNGIYKDNQNDSGAKLPWERYTPEYKEGEFINDNGKVICMTKEQAEKFLAHSKK